MPISVESHWAPDPILVAQELNQTADTLEDFSPALYGAREVIVRDIRGHFDKKEDPGGHPWRKWSRNYEDVGSRINVDGILVQTGAMRDAVTNRMSWQVTGHEVFANTALWSVPNRRGQENARWLWHDQGLDDRMLANTGAIIESLKEAGFSTEGIGENPLPKREFLGLSEDAEFTIFDILDEFVDTAFSVAIHPKTGFAQRRISGRFGPTF